MVTGNAPIDHERIPRRRGQHREHLFPGRPRRISVRLTDNEYADLAAAAHQVGLTFTGFCAEAAIAAACGQQTAVTTEQVELHALAHLQTELFSARVAVNQTRAALSQATHAATGDAPVAGLEDLIRQAAQSLTRLDDAASRIHQRLLQRRPTGRQGKR